MITIGDKRENMMILSDHEPSWWVEKNIRPKWSVAYGQKWSVYTQWDRERMDNVCMNVRCSEKNKWKKYRSENALKETCFKLFFDGLSSSLNFSRISICLPSSFLLSFSK